MTYSLHRRGFLKGALAAGALIPLAACAGGGDDPKATPAGSEPAGGETTTQADPNNPFGLKVPSDVDAAIFNGGYGIAYAEFAGAMVEKQHDGVKVKVSKIQDATTELQPRFAGGDPPDVIDNAGKGKIGLAAILDQLEDLNDVIDSNNYEGDPIRDTLYAGVLEPGTIDDKLAVINYVLTVFGLWYSASLFEENGWEPPKTWDDAIALGAKAKEKGKYLFLWGNEASDYYMELAITSAIKEGGDEVRLALDNLEEGCWSKPALQAVFGKMEEIVKAGYVKPGGGGTQFTAAQAAWSQAQEALLYPSGAWIENEMKSQTKEDFKMTGTPVPTVTASPSKPFEAIHSAADEPYIVPSQGKNVAGGKEFMRAMLSKEAATNFAKEILSPTIVKDTVPEDGFGSTALVSQIGMLGAAGDNVFTWKFNAFYGMGNDTVVLWNSFLDGKLSTAELTSKLQEVTDAIRNDDAIEKFKAS
ncbi:N-acetylglucosamine/diacetylchitobiose ABC transporter substrate-binding protein [Tessaracoccus antarcticus]|uniref:Carbohydrate ABC transporter, N-acetylglucosamine/diacetylchitobiose-binding protein n=1 Tax=Tessaracoccus antarcticus TaxID=2479848 RepID=A0A3M0GAK7_9ACTN|nr:N-acetylglucosamine/diacetylchitobiose ABC transporter substrate-binding protein [Tessaracoccus antarcticus]RMB61944.1 carbohydrate ABC transporter, N-acetylglucosamine/diacetylchitobiose-binding protein [Tessaracoccus antarcticus]